MDRKLSADISDEEHIHERLTLNQLTAGEDLMKEARRSTAIELDIKPHTISVLIPHIIGRRDSDPKKYEKGFMMQSKAMDPMATWKLPNDDNLLQMLHECAEEMKFITRSEGYILYVVDETKEEIFVCSKSMAEITGRRYAWKLNLPGESTIAVYVSQKNKAVAVNNINDEVDNRFPDGQDLGEFYASDVLAVPVRKKDNCVAVVELFKTSGIPYTKHDQNAATYLANIVGSVIVRNRKLVLMQAECDANDFLLTTMIEEISEISLMKVTSFTEYLMNHAKNVLDAESVTFYLFNASLECEKRLTSNFNPTSRLEPKRKRKRFEREVQIAQLVKETGTLVNFVDVFNDPRFDKSVGRYIGMLMRSVLGVEVPNPHNENFGILLAINKQSKDKFSKADEKFLDALAKYMMISLDYKSIINQYQLKLQFNLSLIDVVGYQITRKVKIPEVYSLAETIYIPHDFYSFTFIPNDPYELEIPKYIFHILNSVSAVLPDKDTIYKFIFAVKKVYRPNLYHNFTTAFMSFHFVFLIFYYYPKRFPHFVERLAILMASLLHNADHRGFSAKYLTAIKHPVVFQSTNAPVEMHHFLIAECILESSKILKNIRPEKLAVFKRIFHECILSSNLQFYIKRRVDVKTWLKVNGLQWENPEHRIGIRTMLVTGADLATPVKSAAYAQKAVKNITEELFHEGDLLRDMGINPPNIMSREKIEDVPKHQVTFLSNMTLPCYDILREMFPKTEELYESTLQIIQKWKSYTSGFSFEDTQDENDGDIDDLSLTIDD